MSPHAYIGMVDILSTKGGGGQKCGIGVVGG